MTHDRTYRPVPHAPAPRLRGADGSLRQAPCRSAGYAATHPVPPLKGLPGTRATDVSYRASVPAGHAGRGVALSYRALAPGGAGFCYRICTGTSESQPTANYSLLTANSSYTFSAKEKDSETGLSYFGSRYYSSDLSVWLSVDPQAAKYPSLSPYVYCADNPVKLVDPNGEDWFENELTGDVYYSRYLSKDDVSRIEGEGWKWMGKDDMFGSSPTQLALVDHFNKATFVNSDREGVGTALFEGDNAKKFMSDLGYDFKPSILEVSISEYKQQADVDISGNPIYIYNQLTSEKALKSVYVPKNSTGSYSILNRTAYVDEFLGFHVMKTSWTETRQYTYSTSNFMKYGKVLKQLTPLMIDLYKECKTIQFQQMFHR